MILKHIFQVVAYLFRLHNFCNFCNKSLSVFGISTVLIQKDAYIFCQLCEGVPFLPDGILDSISYLMEYWFRLQNKINSGLGTFTQSNV